VEQTTFSPVFEYKKVHHIPNVTPEFIKYLKGAIEMQIHVTQHIEAPAVSYHVRIYFYACLRVRTLRSQMISSQMLYGLQILTFNYVVYFLYTGQD